jgi:hypothetical protein
LFEQIEQTPRIAVGEADQAFAGGWFDAQIGQRLGTGPVEKLAHLGFVERLEHIHRGPRQQGGIEFKGRVFRRRANESEQAGFDKRQKAVLLRFIKAMDFIDKQNRPPALRPPHFRLRHCLAHLLDAGKHRRQRNELALELCRHHPRQRRLADARRPPQNH